MQVGMKQKLDRAYERGVQDGKTSQHPEAEIKGYIKGCHDTWDIVDNIMANTKGIGPATQQKITAAIRKHAESVSQEEQ